VKYLSECNKLLVSNNLDIDRGLDKLLEARIDMQGLGLDPNSVNHQIESADTEKGLILNRYKILKELASTQFSTVYKAFDSKMQRPVAIKMIESTSKATTWAKREAHLSAQLNHPNICTIYEYEETEDAHYLIMEYLEGATLREILNNSDTLSLDEAVSIIREVSLALEYAHLNYIIHQDIKPENILLLYDGRLKIMDFGTGRLLGFYKEKQKSLIGTPSYMSPEQVEKKPLDDRTDQFSLAIVFYEMLSGISPFEASTMQATLFKIRNSTVEDISRKNSEVGAKLARVLNKALSKNPDERYPIVTDFRYKIERAYPPPDSSKKVLRSLVEMYADLDDEDAVLEDLDSPTGRIKDFIGRAYLKNTRFIKKVLAAFLTASLGFVLFSSIGKSYSLIFFLSLAGLSFVSQPWGLFVLALVGLVALSMNSLMWPAVILIAAGFAWRYVLGKKRLFGLPFSFAAPVLAFFNLQLLFPIIMGISLSPISGFFISLAGAIQVLVISAMLAGSTNLFGNAVMLSQLVSWPLATLAISIFLGKDKTLPKTVVASASVLVLLVITYVIIGASNNLNFEVPLKSASLSLIISLLVLPLIPYDYLETGK